MCGPCVHYVACKPRVREVTQNSYFEFLRQILERRSSQKGGRFLYQNIWEIESDYTGNMRVPLEYYNLTILKVILYDLYWRKYDIAPYQNRITLQRYRQTTK
ncbi:uncharacterized protein EV154DRAFT_552062 [Mucor mucedo]|uniref:uncharacterized protein n=1 Tax=Mucor mucedo TaxID=29922 RepID=UPI00221E5563|nr:uncharacterized protein EV154DRAFT_552062 [Mucor mucedo]KAI7890646.1 hypothetical protein EV154DRAFT_552062 [Mucor mucedo]